MLMTPPRSLKHAPSDASAYGTAIRSAAARNRTNSLMVSTARRASSHPPRHAFEYLVRRDRAEDHEPLQHLDQLARHARVDHEPGVRQRAEEQRGDHHAHGIRAADQRHRDAEEPRAGRE